MLPLPITVSKNCPGAIPMSINYINTRVTKTTDNTTLYTMNNEVNWKECRVVIVAYGRGAGGGIAMVLILSKINYSADTTSVASRQATLNQVRTDQTFDGIIIDNTGQSTSQWLHCPGAIPMSILHHYVDVVAVQLNSV